MKKIFGLALVFSLFLMACNSSDQSSSTAENAPVEKTSKHDPAFLNSFTQFLNNYYTLKDALVATDSAAAIAAVPNFLASADSLGDIKISFDSTGAIAATAADYVQTVKTALNELQNAPNVEAIRKKFQAVSDAMYDLVRTVQYDGETVYHQYCPMAFNDLGAYWLSNVSDIKNPYFGKKMLSCGEVKDSLAF
jgi:major membrane immunogen (membrane-anchored lipoprotein)